MSASKTAGFIATLTAVVLTGGLHSAYCGDPGTFAKCETPMILEALHSGARKPATRPDSSTYDASAVSHLGHFRVHYDTSGWNAPNMTDVDENGVPDYIDSTCVYLEYAWDIQVNGLGFEPPLSDKGAGGGDEVDCYIRNFGSGGYGYTEPETYYYGYATSFMTIDNDYAESQYASNGYAGLRVTTAHEFFHVIHFRYIVDFNLSWWMEQTAVWMEEYVWDDVNDYLAYLGYFFNDTTSQKTALDNNYGTFMYAAAIWPKYLTKKNGVDIIRQSWEAYASTDVRNVDILDDIIPGGLSEAYNEFSVWNYFTKHRANTVDFHDDSDLFGYSVQLEQAAKVTPASATFNCNHLTTRFVEILFVGEYNEDYALHVEVTPEGSAEFTSSVVFYNTPYDYDVHTFNPGEGVYPLGGAWQKAVLVTSCTNTSGSGYSFTYDASIELATSIDDGTVPVFSVAGAYPNPFNPVTSIAFTMNEGGNAAITAYNASGQKVQDLYNGYLAPGEKRILWKPDGLAGGVYFVTIATPGGMKTIKTLFLK